MKLSTSIPISRLGYLVSKDLSWNGEYDSIMGSSFRIMPQGYGIPMQVNGHVIYKKAKISTFLKSEKAASKTK